MQEHKKEPKKNRHEQAEKQEQVEKNQQANAAEPDFLSKINTAPPPEKEKETVAQTKKKLTKREILIITIAVVLLVLLAGLLINSVFGRKASVNQAINYATKDSVSLQYKGSIAQLAIDEDGARHVVAYKVNGGIAFAIVEHNRSGYTVKGEISKIQLDASGDDAWVASSIKEGKEYLVAGIIQNKEYSSVKYNGKNATVIDNGDIRCWFYIGEGNIEIRNDSVVYE